MATIYKILGTAAPSATTNTNLYTVPSATSAVVSTISVCNRDGANPATYRIATRPAGATIANNHYVTYDVEISAGNTHTLTLGITLATTDVITVYASTANLTFIAYGSEIT